MAKKKIVEQPLEEVISELETKYKFTITKKKHGYALTFFTRNITPSRLRHRAEKDSSLYTEQGLRYMLYAQETKTIPKT